MSKQIVGLIAVILSAVYMFAQTSQPAASETPQKVENKTGKPEKTAATEPAEKSKDDEPGAETKIDVHKVMAKAVYEAKVDYNKNLKKLIRDKSVAEQKLAACEKEMEKLSEQINESRKVNRKSSSTPSTSNYQRQYYACFEKKFGYENKIKVSQKNIETFKSLTPGKTYFRKLGTDNMSVGSCGQLMGCKYKVLKKLGDNAILASIAIDEKQTYSGSGSSLRTYTKNTYQTVRLEIPSQNLQVVCGYDDDGVYYVKAIEDSTPVLCKVN